MTTNGEEDRSHSLLSIKMLPESLIELRKELAFHADISEYAAEGNNFEECLARIATKLDIALDGDYEVAELCGVLLAALRGRRFGNSTSYVNRQLGLVSAELIERAGEVTLEAQKNTIYGSGEVIVTEVNTSMPKIEIDTPNKPEIEVPEWVVEENKAAELQAEDHRDDNPDGCEEESCSVCYPTKEAWIRRHWDVSEYGPED